MSEALGTHYHRYDKRSRTPTYVGLVITIPLFIIGIWLLISGAGDYYDTGYRTALGEALAILSGGILAYLIFLVARFTDVETVSVHENGLLIASGEARHTILWTQISRVYEVLDSHRNNPTWVTLKLVLDDNREFIIRTPDIRGVAVLELTDRIHKAITALRLSEAIETVAAGGELGFETATISRQGLVYPPTKLSWKNVMSIVRSDTHILLTASGRVRPYRISLRHLSNAGLFQTLAQHMMDMKRVG